MVIYFYSRLVGLVMPIRERLGFYVTPFIAKISRYSNMMGDKVLFIVDDFIFVGESCNLLYFLTLRLNKKLTFLNLS